LQLRKHGGRTHDEHGDAEDACRAAGVGCAGACDKRLQRCGRLFADHAGELADHGPFDRIAAENHSCRCSHDDKQRREGKEGVVRQSRAHARSVVVNPGGHRFSCESEKAVHELGASFKEVFERPVSSQAGHSFSIDEPAEVRARLM